jgi:hypothetical protein
MLFTLKVHSKAGAASSSAAAQAGTSASATPSQPASPSGLPLGDRDWQQGEASLGWVAGNPRVEHIAGTVHLYRHLSASETAEQAADASGGPPNAWQRRQRPGGGTETPTTGPPGQVRARETPPHPTHTHTHTPAARSAAPRC